MSIRGKVRRRTVYVATIAAMLAMAGGFALAASSSLTVPSPSLGAGTGTPAAFNEASVGSLSIITTDPVGGTSPPSPLGTQAAGAPTATLAGTMTAQTACAVKSCTTYWAPAQETTTAKSGDYAVELNISTTQPASSPAGFDMQISIDLSSGTTVTADIYVDQGATGSTTGVTAILYLNIYIDTGVANSGTAPTISSYAVTANACGTATSCP